MLFVEPIIDAVELTIASRKVIQDTEDEVMVNLALVGASGKGKSKIIKCFYGTEGYALVTNTSYNEIVKTLLGEIHRGEVRTLGFREFNKILARKESTMLSTIGILNPLIDEGIDRIEMPDYHMKFNPPIKANEILGVTTDIFNKYLQNWWEIGFAQRHIFETWSYTKEQIKVICRYIERQKHLKESVFSLELEPREVRLKEKHAKKMRPLAFRLTKSLREYVEKVYKAKGLRPVVPEEPEVIPWRYEKMLCLLLQSSALLDDRGGTLLNDVKKVKRVYRYMNFSYNPLGDVH